MRWGAVGVFVVSLAAASACDVRSRPLPPEVEGELRLRVEVVSPVTNDAFLAGDTAVVVVHGEEDAGRLRGVGFVARRPGPEMPPLDSVVVRFDPVADTTVRFAWALPLSLASNTQIDIYGLAFASSVQGAVSEPQHVIVLVCSVGDIWC
ncbi:MAG TPA: hypothetical protein VF192_06230 [Longimicrobiales bacterium]